MTVRRLCMVPDEILRQKCLKVTKIDDSIRELADDMADTMLENNGVGLAAPQIGVPLRVIVVHDVEVDMYRVMVNPKLVKHKGARTLQEACLSVPRFKGTVYRSESVIVKGLNLDGKEYRIKVKDNLQAQTWEHELDHLDGVLCTDRVASWGQRGAFV